MTLTNIKLSIDPHYTPLVCVKNLQDNTLKFFSNYLDAYHYCHTLQFPFEIYKLTEY